MRRPMAIVALGPFLMSAAFAQDRVEERSYRVHHALFGDIGTLSHSIRIAGGDIHVSTRAEVRVQVLGVTLHHMTVAWDEAWQGGDLREFNGVTLRNGSTMSVHAWPEGGHFVIATGERKQQAPARVQPINPWSPQLVHAAALMSPETGEIVSLAVTDKGSEPMRVAGGAVESVHHYAMGANQLYFDAAGTLVKSEYGDITGAVTFTLIEGAGRGIAQASLSP